MVFIPAAFILGDTKKQSRRSTSLDGLQTILPCPHIFFLSAPGYGYAASSGISHLTLLLDCILPGRLLLRSPHCHRKTYIIYCFFCNSCFSQYNTLCVEEKLVDKILSVSRETQYFPVFLRTFGKFSCEIRIKTGFFAFWLYARRVFVFCSAMRFCADAYCAGEVFFCVFAYWYGLFCCFCSA